MRGEIAARMLVVACSRSERRSRQRSESPIARHRTDAPVRITVPEITGLARSVTLPH